jgi:glycosyltransferase involved in cell wall biosynthesis
VLGMNIAPHKSILVPTAHDEPAIRLEIYKDLFSLPAGLAYNTEVERRFLTTHFSIRAVEEETVGCGVDLPQAQPYPRERAGNQETDAGERAAGANDEPLAADESSPSYRPHLAHRGSVFRRRHRLHGPFLLYGGRIDAGKGCEELIEYFSSYVQEGGDASLVLMGVKLMPLPEEPHIRFAGRLSDQERLQALEAATVVVVPSPYESLSLLALESFAVGTPILANARSEVLVDHCVKSNAGLYYADRDEFIECLKLLVADGRLRATLGRNGREYVKRNYRWDVILGKYEKMFARLRQQPRR